jgi:hypothetical protein
VEPGAAQLLDGLVFPPRPVQVGRVEPIGSESVQRRLGAAMARQEATERLRADTLGAGQAKPGEGLG